MAPSPPPGMFPRTDGQHKVSTGMADWDHVILGSLQFSVAGHRNLLAIFGLPESAQAG